MDRELEKDKHLLLKEDKVENPEVKEEEVKEITN